MKFNISLKVLPLLACGMLMASCNDFLKQEPLTDITPTDYYKDATQLQAVANAFYQTVLPYHSGAGYGTFAYDNGTDNQTGSDGDSKYKKGSWKTSNDNSSWSWNNIRDINYQLNIAQSNYENVGAENLKPEETIESVINHGTLGIGFIGLAECLVALIGKHHGESEKAQELGQKIVTYMRDRANEFSEQYHHNYSILATPAEGLSGKFTKKDRKQFGVIPGVTDRDYYTNSNHVPVYYKCTALKKAQVEAPYHDLTRGGHIFYVEIDGDATHNPSVIESVVDMMDKYNMGYGSVNHNRNRCLDCGYENADAHLEVCPKCGSHHIDKLQRITGYLVGTTDRWNSGKLAELHDRVTHIGGEK